jgi:hypothetical protein
MTAPNPQYGINVKADALRNTLVGTTADACSERRMTLRTMLMWRCRSRR